MNIYTHTLLFTCSVVSDSLHPHGLQHSRLPCPLPSTRAGSDSGPLNQWCRPTISSCRPLLLLPQSFPASGSFPMSQLFSPYGQSIGASASVLPVIVQDWFPLGMTSLLSLQCKGLSSVFSSTTIRKHQFLITQPSLWSNSHTRIWLLEKPQLWLYRLLLAKWCLCFLICGLDLS